MRRLVSAAVLGTVAALAVAALAFGAARGETYKVSAAIQPKVMAGPMVAPAPA